VDLSALRYQWSAVPLTVAAIVLLTLGAVLHVSIPASTAMVGAGAALAGAAATRVIDLDRERRAEAAQAAADRRRDLDETRRLAYMVLAGKGTEGTPRYELAATVVNALAHHQLAVDSETAMRHVRVILDGHGGDVAASEAWLRGQITRINAELRSTGLSGRPVPLAAFIDAPHVRAGHGREAGVGLAEQVTHPRTAGGQDGEHVAEVGRLDVTGAGDGGEDPLRVGLVAVEDEQPPWAVCSGRRWDDGFHG
jgi:hypothetical protein